MGTNKVCNGFNCTSTKLICAHIMPRGIAKHVKRTGSHVLDVTSAGAKRAAAQHGEFDDSILCASCDGKLGVFDDYGITVCRNFHAQHRNIENVLFQVPNVSGEKFAKFALAVLWRASISKRPSLARIKLGPYENLARDILFGARPLTDMRQFQVLVQRYTSSQVDVEGFYTLPVYAPFGQLRAYGFAVAGLRVTAKLDNRPLDSKYNFLVANDKPSLTGFFVKLEGTTEFQALADAAVTQMRREQKRKRRTT